MLFGTSKNLSLQPPVMNVTFGEENINFTTTYKYLGIKIEPNLNMNSNFDQCYKKASSRLRLINKLRSHMTAEACAALYQTMVIPILTYCGIVHLNKTRTQFERSNALHERARRIISNNAARNLRSPESINKTKALTIVRKCIEGSIVENFGNYFETINHTKNTRNQGITLKLPRLRLEYSRGSFFYMGAKLYNELPRETRSLTSFKRFVENIRF
jgi:hypothetical protein